MSTWVVTPTYNEAQNIEPLLAALRALPEPPQVLVVDDSSPDGTAERVEAFAERDPGVHLLSRPGPGGLAGAYLAGFAHALHQGAARVVQMDADGSHDPLSLPEMLAHSADLVLGSRYVSGGGTLNWPLHRRVLSRGGSLYARSWLRLPYRDLTGGFKVWAAPTLKSVLERPVRSEGYSFQVEMTLRAHRGGAEVVEHPIQFVERTQGASKLSGGIVLEAVWVVPALGLGLWRS
ncbi:MAG: polyprenol monophosphomannose synthase [Myxococcota bacterium]|nr:polyprenol monophosphomannose synthase [Myxococcota bacterium]